MPRQMEGGARVAGQGAVRWDRAADVDAALARLFGAGVRPLRLEEAVFDAMVAGWRAQQAARHLAESTKRSHEALVRRFRGEVGLWPWEWRSLHVDEWLEDLGGPPRRLSVSTLRGFRVRCARSGST
jgi:integrase/recombinase XerC